jgi:hypothetical protein
MQPSLHFILLDKVVTCFKKGSWTNPFNTLCVDIKSAKNHSKRIEMSRFNCLNDPKYACYKN